MTFEGPPETGPQETPSSAGRVHHGAQVGTWERPWKGLDWLVLEQAGVEVSDNGYVRVPFRNRDGSTFREHLWSPYRKQPWWGEGVGTALFGLETIPEPEVAAKSALVIVEGEKSALAVREAFAYVAPDGLMPVGYCVLGVPGANGWKPEWSLVADYFARVYLVPDADDAGRRMAKAVLADIPWARLITLADSDDPRDVLQRDGARALDELLEKADMNAALFAALVSAKNPEEFRAKLLSNEGNGS